MDKFWELLINAIKDGDYNLISIILLLFISIWLYNEFRKGYIANKSENKLDIEKALEQYSKLYFGIMSFQLKNIHSNELLEYINQSIPYLPKKITEKILELNKINSDINSSKLEEIKEMIKKEIGLLKSNQYSVNAFDSGENIFEYGSWFFTKNNFDSFVTPLIHFLLTFIVISSVISVITTIESLSGFIKLSGIMFLYNLIFSAFILLHLIDLIIKKKAKVEFLIYSLLLIMLPLYLTIYVLERKYTIINTITIIIFMYIANKKKFLRPKNI